MTLRLGRSSEDSVFSYGLELFFALPSWRYCWTVFLMGVAHTRLHGPGISFTHTLGLLSPPPPTGVGWTGRLNVALWAGERAGVGGRRPGGRGERRKIMASAYGVMAVMKPARKRNWRSIAYQAAACGVAADNNEISA